jgi:hypothetical protein
MKLDIIINKHLLIWHLLYQSSVSMEVHKLKQKLWMDYKKGYTLVHKDKEIILKELDDFIPDDDSIYNMVETSPIFKKIKKETSQYRYILLQIWDENRKKYMKHLNSILRYDTRDNYKICVVHPSLDVIETDFDTNIITIGKKVSMRDKDNFLTYLMYKIIKNDLNNIKTSERDIVDAVVELALTNELYTRVTEESKYSMGKKNLRSLKEKIYPYWLMYLGVKQEDMQKYMIRDNIFFNVNDYTYDKHLCYVDLVTFIGFIIKNKRKVLRIRTVQIEDIEVL